MKIIFTKCQKLMDRLDLTCKIREVKSVIETVNGEPLIDFAWPDFIIENKEGSIIRVSDKDLMKIKKTLGASYFIITS